MNEKDEPCFSWRVILLPYLDEEELFRKFKLNEPWDSPHNKKLLGEMPDVFKNPNPSPENQTNFLAITGKGTAFEKNGKTITFGSILDGSSNTIFAVEADNFVPWTKPVDVDIDSKGFEKKLGHHRPQLFNALLGDGSVRPITGKIDLDILLRICRIADGTE